MKWKYFKYEEFRCPCCGENDISLELIARLDAARGIAGIPFIITSSYRCEKHNKEVGGVEKSSHLKGLAADIAYKDARELFLIIKGLMFAGFTRMHIGPAYIHVDIDMFKAQRIMF